MEMVVIMGLRIDEVVMRSKYNIFFTVVVMAVALIPLAAKADACFVKKHIAIADGCESPSHIVVFSTNDHHGSIFGKKTKSGSREGGLARQSKWIGGQIDIDNKRLSCPAHLLLSAGDIMSGDIVTDLGDNRADFAAMSKMGFDAMVLGNHEFDHGVTILNDVIEDVVDFPILSANISYPTGNGCPYPRYMIMDIGKKDKNYRVAILGLTTENVDLPQEDKGKLDFKKPQDIAAKIIPQIEGRHKPDALILLGHLGGANADISEKKGSSSALIARQNNGAIDLVVDGHDHVLLEKPAVVLNDSKKTLIMEAGSNSLHVTKIVLEIKDSVRLGDSPFEYTVRRMDNSIAEDGRILSIASKYASDPRVKSYADVIFEKNPVFLNGNASDVRSHETNLSRFMNDAYSFCGNADFSVISPSSVRNSIFPGEVTAADIANVSPFTNDNNTMVVARLTESQVAELFELAKTQKLEQKKPFLYFSSPLKKYVDGKLARGDKVYKVAGILYTFEKVLNGKYSFEKINRSDEPYFAYDCMVDYAKNLKKNYGDTALIKYRD